MKIPHEHVGWLPKYSGRWIVADLNRLQALPNDAALPAGNLLVIPDQLFAEIADGAVGTNKDPQRRLAKIGNIVADPRHKGRVIIGRYWSDLAEEERSPQKVDTSAFRVANRELTELVEAVQDGVASFAFNRRAKEVLDAERRQERFMELVDGFSRQVHALPRTRRQRLERDREKAIAEMFGKADSRFSKRMEMFPEWMRGRRWQSELDRFPDRVAAGVFRTRV